ncbi:MAG TPA: hypothetical protein VH518_06565 [Tepidisphaeraceae bacterium]|jgi:hypothetical protein
MKLLAEQPDQRIPFCLLMLSLAAGFREEIEAQSLRPSKRIDEFVTGFALDRSDEEPERWDGMS